MRFVRIAKYRKLNVWYESLAFREKCVNQKTIKGRRRQSQIFYSRNFVTEIFAKYFYRLSFLKNLKMPKNENFWKWFAKISVTKFCELRIWECYLLPFSVLVAVVYSVFLLDTFFTEKIAEQNWLFFLFWRKKNKKRLKVGAILTPYTDLHNFGS